MLSALLTGFLVSAAAAPVEVGGSVGLGGSNTGVHTTAGVRVAPLPAWTVGGDVVRMTSGWWTPYEAVRLRLAWAPERRDLRGFYVGPYGGARYAHWDTYLRGIEVEGTSWYPEVGAAAGLRVFVAGPMYGELEVGADVNAAVADATEPAGFLRLSVGFASVDRTAQPSPFEKPAISLRDGRPYLRGYKPLGELEDAELDTLLRRTSGRVQAGGVTTLVTGAGTGALLVATALSYDTLEQIGLGILAGMVAIPTGASAWAWTQSRSRKRRLLEERAARSAAVE